MSESPLTVVSENRCRNFDVCRGDASDAPARGPYAHLCARCRQEKGQQMGAERKQKNSERRQSSESRSLDDALTRLKNASRRLAKAAGAEQQIRQERQLAIGEFNAAIRAVNEQARRVLQAPTMAGARVEERMERELADIEASQQS